MIVKSEFTSFPFKSTKCCILSERKHKSTKKISRNVDKKHRKPCFFCEFLILFQQKTLYDSIFGREDTHGR